MLVQYAITWYITLETQSGIMMTISIICGFLPTFFISPFAGVWADRYNKKLLIILSDGVIAFSTLILIILFFMGYKSMWLIFLISSIRAIGSGIQSPTIGAFLPSFVPEDKLKKINATNGSIQSLVMLICPMISGALLNMTTLEMIFIIDVVTAAVAIIILILFLNVPSDKKSSEIKEITYFEDMANGIKYIKNHVFVKTLFLFCGVHYVLVTPLAFLTPLQASRSFGNDVWRLTAIEVTFSGGMIIGGIIMAYWGGFKNKLHTMVLSYISIAICTFALGITNIFWIYLSFMIVVGVVMPMFNTPFTVLLQQKIEPEFLGRIFGVLGMISSSTMPLSMLVFGPVADFIKIEWLLIGSGLLMFIQSIFMLKSKVLVEAGKPIKE
jgi:MFS transporter, DHA3 family, macrolide efflux protein